MKCSEVREAISARLDGERSPLDDLTIERHLTECAECRSFREQLDLVATLAPEQAPDLTESILSTLAARPRARPRLSAFELRLGVALIAFGELAASTFLFLRDHGYNGVDHAGHESLSFTIAICVGLLVAAARPAYAGPYLPIIGVAVALLWVTAAVDLRAGRAELIEELPHVDLMIGFVLLWLLARRESGGRRRRWLPVTGSPFAGARDRLRVVTRTRWAVSPPSLVLVRRALAIGLVAGGFLMVASPADAHAVLEGSNPAPDVTVVAAPRTVTLRYDEAVTILPTSLRVFGPDGDRVDQGVVTHPGGVGAQVSVNLDQLTTQGTYLVSWRVISADSHPVSGAYTFSFGRASRAPAIAAVQNNRSVAFALGTARWLGYLGSALLLGGVGFLLLCWPAGWTAEGARGLLGLGAGALGVGAAASLLLKGPYDAALGLGQVGQWSLISEVLHTTYGHGLVLRLVLVGVAALVVARTRTPPGSWAVTAFVLLGGGLLVSFAVTGHAVAGTQRPLALGSDMLHVAAMSLWLGGLLMLSLVVLRQREIREILPIVGRFSRVAASAVVVLVATGTYQSWRQVGSWAALPTTTYGRELMIKVGIVVAVLVAAGFSRTWVARRLRPPVVVHAATATIAEPETKPATTDLRGIRRSVGLEVAGAIAVLVVTSMLVVTEPAKTAYHPTVAATLTLGGDTVQVSAVPAGDRRMSVHLYVFDKTLQPSDPAQLTATASLPSQTIGPLPITLDHVDVGHEVGDISVPVAGTWQLTVTVRTTAIDEYTGQVTLPIH
ncbi:MAG: hypothetical protein JWQ32_2494 [Marmoricola sp.]|nr:hypothetical protein [Marmoricola sp.]